jgi:hypothetical protein
MKKYETITPTWTELLGVMLAVIERELPEEVSTRAEQSEYDQLVKAKDNIRAEFIRMAQAADNWNLVMKNKETKKLIENDPLFQETGGRAGRLK